MNLPLAINNKIVIPASLLNYSAVRASGPGGQNVNKVATKIEIRFNPYSFYGFSNAVRTRLLKLAGSRVDSEGNIIISSQKYREQHRNIVDAREKLKHLILKALRPPKPRKPTKPTRASIERRIASKKKKSEKKSMRKKQLDFDD